VGTCPAPISPRHASAWPRHPNKTTKKREGAAQPLSRPPLSVGPAYIPIREERVTSIQIVCVSSQEIPGRRGMRGGEAVL
jgi:hypothetical protein